MPQKVSFLKIYDDTIACDLWFGPSPQSKILATSMQAGIAVRTLTQTQGSKEKERTLN